MVSEITQDDRTRLKTNGSDPTCTKRTQTGVRGRLGAHGHCTSCVFVLYRRAAVRRLFDAVVLLGHHAATYN